MGKKILVIEDSPASAEIIEDIIIKEGHTPIIAITGKEGVAKAIVERPDIAVIDVMLPDINGIEVCRQIRETLDHGATKIIMTTAFIDAIDVVGAKKAGADEFSVKTEDMQNFKTALQSFI